jgi:hypothetical protein
MPSDYIPDSIRQIVAARAGGYCEYCYCPEAFATERFAVDHIQPRAMGGLTVLENLAWSCIGCNGHKHRKTKALDPATGNLTPLFHPCQQCWSDHFAWNADFTQIMGHTTCGRATIEALHLNRPGIVNLRRLLVMAGLHPPAQSMGDRTLREGNGQSVND